MRHRQSALKTTELISYANQVSDLRKELDKRLSALTQKYPHNVALQQYFIKALKRLGDINTQISKINEKAIKLSELDNPRTIRSGSQELSDEINLNILAELDTINSIEIATRSFPEKLAKIKTQNERIQTLESEIKMILESIGPQIKHDVAASNLEDRLHHINMSLSDLYLTLQDQQNPEKMTQAKFDKIVDSIKTELSDIEHQVATYKKIADELEKNALEPDFEAVEITADNTDVLSDAQKNLMNRIMQEKITQDDISTLLQVIAIHRFIQDIPPNNTHLDLNLLDQFHNNKLNVERMNNYIKLLSKETITPIDSKDQNDKRNDLFIKLEEKDITSDEIDLLIKSDLVKMQKLLADRQQMYADQFKLTLTACLTNNPFVTQVSNQNMTKAKEESKSESGDELSPLNASQESAAQNQELKKTQKFVFNSANSNAVIKQLMAQETDLSLRGQFRKLTQKMSKPLNLGRSQDDSKKKLSLLAHPERKEALKRKSADLSLDQNNQAIFVPIDNASAPIGNASADDKIAAIDSGDADKDFEFVPVQESAIDNLLEEQEEDEGIEYVFELAPPSPVAQIPHQENAVENENQPQHSENNIKAKS